MKALYDLKEKLNDELKEIARKPEMGAGDLELVHKLTDTIKNIDKICALEEDGGYAQAGEPGQQLPGPEARLHGPVQPGWVQQSRVQPTRRQRGHDDAAERDDGLHLHRARA